MKLLMVDDSFVNRKLNKSLLSDLPITELVETDNGRTAIDMIRRRGYQNGFDLILTDISMPQLDGISMIRELLADPLFPFTPIIVITDHLEDSFLEEAFNAGAADYLMRPVRKFELIARIQSAYRLKRETAENEQHISDLQTAIENLETLNKLMPICGRCKRIRDDQGYWNQVEKYIGERSFAEFTHGLCPECIQSLYGAFLEKS